MSIERWTPWRPLAGVTGFSAEALHETLYEGQAFRWNPVENGVYQGYFGAHVVRVKLAGATLEWATLDGHTAQVQKALEAYFVAEQDWLQLADSLPWRSDAILAQAMAHYPGMRILKQPPGDALIAFILSSTKQIPQIKRSCELIAERFGKELAPGHHALPDWKTLSEIPEADLRQTGIGYRAKYLKGIASELTAKPDWLSQVATLPYADARDALITLPGVGGKIADCVLLYGFGRLESFPVDTWIHKAMCRLYQLDGWNPEAVAQFGRVHFGPYAGLAQQFLFTAERRKKLKIS